MNIKMYLPDTADKPREELSREVQEHAFKMGYVWLVEEEPITLTDQAFLVFYDNCNMVCGFKKRIAYTNSFTSFKEERATELTPEQFLRLPTSETNKYRPYFDKELIDLIGEIIMDKHRFKEHEISGIKMGKQFVSINIVTNSWISTLISPRTLLDHFTFIDGSPCGILLTGKKVDREGGIQ